MKFAKIVFWISGIWGVIVLTPLYFIFDLIGRQDPPAITHPGFYYGFASIGLAFQFAFIVIALDPVRMRPMMIPAMIEKVRRRRYFRNSLPAASPDSGRPCAWLY
jgi:hypothetical protein